jgi:hypothetical protein
MPRIPHAARTLASQLGERYKNVEMEASGDADGLGVHREVKFEKHAGKFLAKVLPHLDDPRIVDFKATKAGVVTVTFSDRTIADSRDSFPLDAAETVASSAAEGEDEDDGDDALGS